MITHIRICKEKGDQIDNRPALYDGKFSDEDLINKDVIVGELLRNILNMFHDYGITQDNLSKSIDEGERIVIKLWKENSQKI